MTLTDARRALLDALTNERFGTPMFGRPPTPLADASAEADPDVCLGCHSIVETLDAPCPMCAAQREIRTTNPENRRTA